MGGTVPDPGPDPPAARAPRRPPLPRRAAYWGVAMALRLFALNGMTRRLYRLIGNRLNARRDTTILGKYFHFTPGIYAVLTGIGALRDGVRMLEIGTGWAHWDALIARNHAAIRATLCDIWDNRSLERFRAYLVQLAEPDIRHRLGLDPERGRDLMARAAAATSFEAAYDLLGFDYVIDPSGRLESLAGPFDLIVSRDVGEHVRREDVDAFCRGTFALLRPGGVAFHQIVLTDHLNIYVRGIHPKEYLRFDRSFHGRWVSNGIQYTNLLQVPDWSDRFLSAGLDVLDIRRAAVHPLDGLAIHPSWQGIPPEDLACTVLHCLLRRPQAG
jgi:hypothetical protein